MIYDESAVRELGTLILRVEESQLELTKHITNYINNKHIFCDEYINTPTPESSHRAIKVCEIDGKRKKFYDAYGQSYSFNNATFDILVQLFIIVANYEKHNQGSSRETKTKIVLNRWQKVLGG